VGREERLAGRICAGLRKDIDMRFFRHLGQLLKEFGVFAWENKAWWIVPIVLVLLLLAALIVVGQTAAPFIYTLF
jgi:hypothetical protein